ncbi:hypothetical protein QYF61_014458 [Mycteria americana]|uniref:ribonuclease H n=1 Tax=Mycteria americana TaxID=33587 RepID=A0AAN7MT73_MYCAM|nr:hypothetical protein QYF61_014458 [Mycteria americana]
MPRGVCVSPYNTPILPVKKNRLDEDGDLEYRFVQDLWVVNQHVVTLHPVVPDPSTILLQIPHWARSITVKYLTAAFFSIPLDEDSQLLFAFTRKGQQLNWMHLPQGFAGSPTIFSQILRNYLRHIKLLDKSALVQYVDDLLIASKDEDTCIKDTIHLCTALAEKGHCAYPSKLQLCQKEYLGRKGAPVSSVELPTAKELRLNFTPNFLYLLSPSSAGGWEMGVAVSSSHIVSATPSSSHSSPAPVWGPTHRRQSSMNFSNVGPSHGLQFFRNGLLQCGALHGLQVDICSTVNLHGLQGDNLLHHGLHHGLQGNLCSGTWSTSSPSFFTDLGKTSCLCEVYGETALYADGAA